jgi:hypothetical protein
MQQTNKAQVVNFSHEVDGASIPVILYDGDRLTSARVTDSSVLLTEMPHVDARFQGTITASHNVGIVYQAVVDALGSGEPVLLPLPEYDVGEPHELLDGHEGKVVEIQYEIPPIGGALHSSWADAPVDERIKNPYKASVRVVVNEGKGLAILATHGGKIDNQYLLSKKGYEPIDVDPNAAMTILPLQAFIDGTRVEKVSEVEATPLESMVLSALQEQKGRDTTEHSDRKHMVRETHTERPQREYRTATGEVFLY